MQVRILLTTPKGQARRTMQTLKAVTFVQRFLFLHGKIDFHANDEDTQVLLDCEGSPRVCFDLQKEVARFRATMLSVEGNKLVKKFINARSTEEERGQLHDMLVNGTRMEIVKQAEAEELAQDEKSLFARIREKIFKR